MDSDFYRSLTEGAQWDQRCPVSSEHMTPQEMLIIVIRVTFK